MTAKVFSGTMGCIFSTDSSKDVKSPNGFLLENPTLCGGAAIVAFIIISLVMCSRFGGGTYGFYTTSTFFVATVAFLGAVAFFLGA